MSINLIKLMSGNDVGKAIEKVGGVILEMSPRASHKSIKSCSTSEPHLQSNISFPGNLLNRHNNK